MSDEEQAAPAPVVPKHTLGACTENLRRINKAMGHVDEAAKGIQEAFSVWTNRKDADDITSGLSTETQRAVDRLRRALVDDKRIWLGHLQEAQAAAKAGV